MLLTRAIDEAAAVELARGGCAVWTFANPQQASVKNLAYVALELRKRYPRLKLITLGPPRMMQRFAARYPPLTDGTSLDQM